MGLGIGRRIGVSRVAVVLEKGDDETRVSVVVLSGLWVGDGKWSS